MCVKETDFFFSFHLASGLHFHNEQSKIGSETKGICIWGIDTNPYP